MLENGARCLHMKNKKVYEFKKMFDKWLNVRMLEELFGAKAEKPEDALKAKHFLKSKLAFIRVVATDEL